MAEWKMEILMNIMQLEYFYTVAQEKNITRAANKLYISQPALSSTIKSIENDIGYQLFDRVGRQIVLNDNGQIFLEGAKTILDTWSETMNKLVEANLIERNTLSLAVTGIEAPQPILQKFRKNCPDTKIKQFFVHTDELPSIVHQNSWDFIFSSILPMDSSLESLLILEEALMVVLPSNHLLAQRDGIYLSEIMNEQFVVMPQKTVFRQLTDDICKEAGFKPNIALEVYSSQLTDFVSQENGIAIIAAFSSAKHIASPHIKVLPLLDQFCKYRIHLIWRKKDVPFKDSLKLFYDFIVKHHTL